MHRINGDHGRASSDDLFTLTVIAENAGEIARPSSAHHKGVNPGMGDGSSRFVVESIDYRVYQAMLAPRGRHSDVPEPSFVYENERQ